MPPGPRPKFNTSHFRTEGDSRVEKVERCWKVLAPCSRHAAPGTAEVPSEPVCSQVIHSVQAPVEGRAQSIGRSAEIGLDHQVRNVFIMASPPKRVLAVWPTIQEYI